MKPSLLFSILSLFNIFSWSFADVRQQANKEIVDSLETALTIAQLFSYELRVRSIEIPVALDMITAISMEGNPPIEQVPTKYRKLISNVRFRNWQKKMKNISGSIKLTKPARKGQSYLITYWWVLIDNLNKQPAPYHKPEGSDKELLMKLNHDLRPLYPGILGNIQMLKYAEQEPVHIDDYRIILDYLEHLKDVLDRYDYSSCELAWLLVDFTRHCIERLEQGIKDLIEQNHPSTEYWFKS